MLMDMGFLKLLQPLVLPAIPSSETDSVETFTGLETLETIPNAALAANRVKMSYWMVTMPFCLSPDASNPRDQSRLPCFSCMAMTHSF